MASGATAVARSSRIPSLNGNAKLPIEQIAASWQCRKRDGQLVPFDADKIRKALARCFQSIGMAEADRPAIIERVARGVVLSLELYVNDSPVDIEDVQRLVVRQLFVENLLDAGEHYQNYREERRKSRLESRPLSDREVSAVAEDRKHFPTDLQYYQFIGKFSRWKEDAQRRETWHEAVHERVMPWFKGLPLVKDKLNNDEWEMLAKAMYDLEASPAMRVVQMAGPSLERCNVGCYNCSYLPIVDLFAFAEMLYILMQGSGVGFSVEYDYVSELPRIRKQKANAVTHKFVVPDTTEGWCDALYFGMQKWFVGEDVEYDVSLVRLAGTRLKTKGGRASGPDPLVELLTFVRNIVLSRQGGFLTDLDVHDICCKIGKIVQVGGVRRASLISLSELHSPLMRHAKGGMWWETAKQREMANNSAVYDGRPADVAEFMDEWTALVRSKSGERGIFNRRAALEHLPSRRKRKKFGTNPCAEIILREFGFCNLSIVVARPWDTPESLMRKVICATYFGTMQATATDFRYIRSEWKKNAEEERLLGVDITGHADCPLLRYGAPGRDELLDKLRNAVAETNAKLAARFGINRSACDTCVKPSGDSSIFFDCGSGISPRYSEYQIRTVRESIHTPLAQFLIDQGVPHEVSQHNPELLVFSFPKQSPAGATLRNDLTAIQQLDNWLTWKQHWAEHSVSATIYVDEHEWLAVGAWVYEHFDHITGLSFLPKDNGIYAQAPNQELTKAQYEKMVAEFPEIEWAKLCRYEDDDQTESAQTLACVGGTCEL